MRDKPGAHFFVIESRELLQLSDSYSIAGDESHEHQPHHHRHQPRRGARTCRAMVRGAMGHPMLELVVELDRESHERVRQKCWQRKPAIHTCNDRAYGAFPSAPPDSKFDHLVLTLVRASRSLLSPAVRSGLPAV